MAIGFVLITTEPGQEKSVREKLEKIEKDQRQRYKNKHVKKS